MTALHGKNALVCALSEYISGLPACEQINDYKILFTN